MAGIVTYLAVLLLIVHGLVHLLGTAAYLDLATIAELPYKTTLLGGAIDIGDAGMRIYGVLWAIASLGFIASAGALFIDWHSWRPLLYTVTLFSLALTALDWTVAHTGVVVNIGILAVLFLQPRL